MELKYLLVADSASESREGKLSVFGIIESLGAFNFPVSHPILSVAVALVVRPADVGKTQTVSIRLLTEDGIQMSTTDIPVQHSSDPLPMVHPIIHIVSNHVMINFENPGRYEFSVEVDGHQIGSTSINLVQMAVPAR